MGIPSWAYASNYNLGTNPLTNTIEPFSERTTVTIPIIVYDKEDQSSPETRIFDNSVDSTLLPTYSNAEFFWIKSTGMPQTAWLGQPQSVNAYTPLPQRYVFKLPREERTIDGKTTAGFPRKLSNTSTEGFFGVAIDGVPFRSPNSGIIADIGGEQYTENSALYPIQSYQDDSTDPWGPFSDGSGIIRSDRRFHYITDPRFLYEKDPTKHSPIIGYAFDGNPIYGPYGYSNSFIGDWSSTYTRTASVYLESHDRWVFGEIVDTDNQGYNVLYNDLTLNSSIIRFFPLEYVRNIETAIYTTSNIRYSYKVNDIVRFNDTYFILTEELDSFTYDKDRPEDTYNFPSPNIDSHWRETLPTELYNVMRSSYRLKETQRYSGTIPDGTYIEDYEYIIAFGDLDKCNGRNCVTPEYPRGTYAYFVTVDPNDTYLPRYPYILGPTYYNEPLLPNGSFIFPGDISLDLISGQLPPGLRIEDLNIVGTPFEVPTEKNFRFVLRATNATGLSDRTYDITIEGADKPIWVTPSGDLEIGTSGDRSNFVDRTLAEQANEGNYILKLTSVKNVLKNSIISVKENNIVKFTSGVNNIGSNTLKVDSVSDLKLGSYIIPPQGSNCLPSNATTIIDINFVTNIITMSHSLLKTLPSGIRFTFSHLPSNPFASNTQITSIDTISKTVSLSKPVISEIPWGTRLRFTSTYRHVNLFVVDGDYVNYQLSAIDQDLATGQKLTYYIPPRGGELPPGLSLSLDGIISGFAEPIILNDAGEYNGNYDMQLYDRYAYDYGVRPYNGFDSFLYDNTIFDYSDLVRNPRKLNRYYSFIVRAFDGQYYEDRRFRIFVIGDDMFRSDTTIMEVGSRIYTADITPIRKPFWLTPSYLGKRRANNYITMFLDVYDVNTLRGALGYVLDPVNDDGSISRLPPGMILDQTSGELYGDVPYQPAVTKTYKFTVRAIRYDPDNPLYGYEKFTSSVNSVGQNALKLDSVLNLRIDSLVTSSQGNNYIIPGTVITSIDEGSKTVTLSTNIQNTIPSGTRFTFSYVVSSAKTFTLDIIGEIDSTIRFITEGDLGEIPANFISSLQVEATSTVTNAVLNYTLIGGRLPPGLNLIGDGTIQGKVKQFSEGIYRSFWKAYRVYAIDDIVLYNDKYYIATVPSEESSFNLNQWIEYYQFPDGIFKSYWRPFISYFINDIVRYEDNYYIATSPNNSETFSYETWDVYIDQSGGLTIFDQNDFTLDKSNTTIDRDYKFIVLAQDQFKLSAITKNFTISITTPNDLLYSNIYVKPFLKTNKRLELTDFFTNPEIFTHTMLYRPSDQSFGVQTELKMLMYAGIETKVASEYVAALGRSSRKRYRFGSVKKAIAKSPGTNNVVYEAVYIEVIDNMENDKGSIPTSFKVKIGKDPTRKDPDNGTNPLETKIKVNQGKRDLWDVSSNTIFYNKLSASIGSSTLTINSIYNIEVNDLITSAIGSYFQKETAILSIDKDSNTIVISKPLISSIPANTQIRFDKDDLSRILVQDKVMTADYNGQTVGDINYRSLFGNSTTNIRKNIEKIGETERNFLPLWMRTPQSFSGIEQGFTKGILLCYAKPGYGDTIVNNIKNLGIDFKSIDFTVDRVIIDSVKGDDGDKYIAFAAREIING